MRSAFNNVVHLEGLLEGTRSRGSGPDGRRVTLFISVRRDIYDDKGNRDVRDEPHEMSVDRRASRTVTELKKGTPVSIDGSLTLKPIVLGSEEHLVSHVTANRVQVLNLSYIRRFRMRGENQEEHLSGSDQLCWSQR